MDELYESYSIKRDDVLNELQNTAARKMTTWEFYQLLYNTGYQAAVVEAHEPLNRLFRAVSNYVHSSDPAGEIVSELGEAMDGLRDLRMRYKAGEAS